MSSARHPRLLPALATAALLAALPMAAPAAAHNTYPGASHAHDEAGTAAYARLPLAFEPNRGQSAADVDFVARGRGYTIALNAAAAIIGLDETAVRMDIVGGQTANPTALEDLPGRVNYLIGGDATAWRTDIPTYSRVEYQNVYPGIDLAYYGHQNRLEYDFIVAPGASHAAIGLGFDTVDSLELDAQGDLLLHTPVGDLRQPRPTIYQHADGQRHAIDGGFVLMGARQVGFTVGAYDTELPLIIDPALEYSTFLGGKGDDNFWGNVWTGAIAVDNSGSAYVVGSTTSPNFPVTGGALQPVFKGGGMDVFVAKLTPSGSALEYATYLGGTGFEMGNGIAVDRFGSAYVTGLTNSATDFPLVNALQPVFGGGAEDAFVAKLNPKGSGLEYSTFLGGSGPGWGGLATGIALDGALNARVTGVTNSTDYLMVNAWQPAFGGVTDVFVTKLNASGTSALYSTFLGSAGEDYGRAIAVDRLNNAYITGSTLSDGLASSPNVLQPTRNGPSDAFAAKFSPAGTRVYFTYMGGGGDDTGRGVAADNAGNAYVAGGTGGTFYTTPGWFKQVCLDPNGFVAKLNATATALVYAGCLDAPGKDSIFGLALDRAENVYVTGFTLSPSFPIVAAFQPTLKGTQDAFVAKINATGSVLVYSSYLGGSGAEAGLGVAVDTSGHAYVTGLTGSPNDFPLKAPLQPTFGGGAWDAFVVKIDCGV